MKHIKSYNELNELNEENALWGGDTPSNITNPDDDNLHNHKNNLLYNFEAIMRNIKKMDDEQCKKLYPLIYKESVHILWEVYQILPPPPKDKVKLTDIDFTPDSK